MKANRILASMLLILAVGFLAPTAAAQVYRWTDGSGSVHYSDTPPSSGQYKRVNSAAMPVQPNNAVKENLPDFSNKKQPKEQVDQAQKKRMAEYRQKNCEQAQSRLDYLKGYKARHALIKGKDGKMHRMTEEERQSRIRTARAVIKKACVKK